MGKNEQEYELKPQSEISSKIIPVDIKEADTYVFDGATLTCPIMKVYENTGATINLGAQKIGGLKLKITNEDVILMGAKGIATEEDKYQENFIVSDLFAYCPKLNGPCKVKPGYWTNTTERIYKNGERVLNKNSKYICMNNPDMKLKIENNGQIFDKFSGYINMMRKSVNWTPSNPYVEQFIVSALGINGGKEMMRSGALIFSNSLHPYGKLAGGIVFAIGGIMTISGVRGSASSILSGIHGKQSDALKIIFSKVGFTQKESENTVKIVDKIFQYNDRLAIVINIGMLSKEEHGKFLEKIKLAATNRAGRKNIAYNMTGSRKLYGTGLYKNELIDIAKQGKKVKYITILAGGIKETYANKEKLLEALANAEIEYSTRRIDSLSGQEIFDLNIDYIDKRAFVEVVVD